MRTAAKVDDNQGAIVNALRGVGATVQTLHSVGKGCPDLLVGFRGLNILMEIKDGNKPPSRQKLTPDQVHWHKQWYGEVHVVCSILDAMEVIRESQPYKLAQQ